MGVCISKTEKDAIDKAEVTAARSCFKSPVMDDGNSEVLENKDTFSIFYRTTESNIFCWNHRLTSCWVLLLAGVKHCIAEGNTPKLHENISMATLNALKYNWHFFLYCFFLNNYPWITGEEKNHEGAGFKMEGSKRVTMSLPVVYSSSERGITVREIIG